MTPSQNSGTYQIEGTTQETEAQRLQSILVTEDTRLAEILSACVAARDRLSAQIEDIEQARDAAKTALARLSALTEAPQTAVEPDPAFAPSYRPVVGTLYPGDSTTVKQSPHQ